MALKLDSITNHVLEIILLMLHDTSRKSLFSLLLTNHTLNESTKPFIIRTLSLDFSQKCIQPTNERITNWIIAPELLKCIRTIIIHDHQASSHNPIRIANDDWIPLATLLPLATGLKQVTFSCRSPFPPAILDALESHHPHARLDIQNWTRRHPCMGFGDPTELALAKSPILRSIQAHVYFMVGPYAAKVGPHADLQRPAFMRIAALAPNLEFFKFSRVYSSFHHLNADIPLDDKDIPLHRIKVNEEKELFAVKDPIPRPYKRFELSEYTSFSQLVLPELPFVDWSRVESLTSVTFDDLFVDKPLEGTLFTSLKSISMRFNTMSTEETTVFDTFLSSLPPLESLTISDGVRRVSLPHLLSRHGPTLRTFHLHEIESRQEEYPRRPLTIDQITLIRDSCPLLQDLGIDVDRTVKRESEARVYALLSTFSALEALTVYFDTGVGLMFRPGPKSLLSQVYTPVSRAHLREIWEAVGGRSLEKLTVCVGEQDVDTGLAAYLPLRSSAKVVVTRHERDDRKDDIVIPEWVN